MQNANELAAAMIPKAVLAENIASQVQAAREGPEFGQPQVCFVSLLSQIGFPKSA